MGAHGQTAALLILEFHISCKPPLACPAPRPSQRLPRFRIRIFAIARTASIVCLLLIRSRRNQSPQSRLGSGSQCVIRVAVRRSAEKQSDLHLPPCPDNRSPLPTEPRKRRTVPVAEDPTELVWVVAVAEDQRVT